jgi:peroxiredoxin
MLARAIPLRRSTVSQQKRSFTVGQNLLETKINLRDVEGKEKSVKEIFGGKKVVVIGVPGAFTPVCSSKHVHNQIFFF